MIKKLIDETNEALDKELYLTALTAALTLPDICGKAEYPSEGNGKRYTKWCERFLNDNNLPADKVYSLRCSLLHEGNVTVDSKDNVKFRLLINSLTKPYGIGFGVTSRVKRRDGSLEIVHDVYVDYICAVICNAASSYYMANKNKFSFLNYEIVDLASVFGLFMK